MSHAPIVLVVEDDVHICKLIAVLLDEAGYRPLTANTAAAALASVERDQPDLMILDWMLPDMSGVQVCRVVKERTAGTFLPVLMLTARSEPADRVAGLDAGADDYVTKPFHGDELLARARALLRIRAAELARSETLGALARQHEELKVAYEKLRSTQAQLVQASKLASLGELVASVAHEMNNPLAIILGNAELLPSLADEEDRRSVRQIIDAAQRARRVLQSLVTFARNGPVESDWHDPRDLIERVLDLKRTALETEEIALDVAYDSLLPMLWCDGPQIQHVLLNLLINAEQALVGWSHPRIAIQVYTSSAPVEPPAPWQRLARPEARAGGERMLVIDVADNGPGLAPQIVGRLFEPFVTTRPVGQGTGMGLAIAYAIVDQHGGRLQIGSEPGGGVTFRIALPIERRPAPLAPGPPAAPPPAAAGRVMVIDDEPAIVDLVSRILTRNHYTVVGMQRAGAALDELLRVPFDTVLCDIRMPDMDGMTFYRQLQAAQIDPAPRLIIMTGDTNNTPTEEFLRQHGLPVLRKPFTRQELLAALAANES
ncbi:MAG TPA: response regulator [Roseiflexaceae bacterium]